MMIDDLCPGNVAYFNLLEDHQIYSMDFPWENLHVPLFFDIPSGYLT